MKLAEDMVARGSLTSSLSHLLQNYLTTTTPPPLGNNNVCRMDNVSTMITTVPEGHDSPSLQRVQIQGLSPTMGLENNVDSYTDSNLKNNAGVISEVVSCVSDMWS